MKIPAIFIAILFLFSSAAEAGKHRSYQAKAEFKRQHPCPANGHKRGPCPGYIVDHIQALKRGGADSAKNMQWQTVEEAKQKDRWE